MVWKWGKDLENRAAHSRQEFLGVLLGGIDFTFSSGALSSGSGNL